MRRFLITLLALCSCAHFDASKLEAWALEKAQRVAECAARSLPTRHDAERCLGDAFLYDLGTPACDEAEALLSSKALLDG